MSVKIATISFEAVRVRKIWHEGEQWISALDVAKALGYENPSKAVAKMLSRNKERMLGYSTTTKLGVLEGGIEKQRATTFLNLKGVIAFCMLSEMPNAIPFQRWADGVLAKHINRVPSDIKLIAATKRVKFTDQLKDHGINKPHEYINITRSMKENLDIDKNKPKDQCDLIEVMKIAAAEDIARINLLQNQADGYREVKPVCDQAASVVRIGTQKTLPEATHEQ